MRGVPGRFRRADLGANSRETVHVSMRPNHPYAADSMGQVSSIVLRLSLSPEYPAVSHCVGAEGEGEMLMNMNALSSIGYLQPNELLLVVQDNEAYTSTGGQRTFTDMVTLASVASSCGLKAWRAVDGKNLSATPAAAADVEGSGFVHVGISKENAGVPLLEDDDPVPMGHTFTSGLKGRIAA